MSRRTQILIAIVALLIAAATGFYVYRTFSRMVTTAHVVTPAQPIPAGALILPEMLEEREVPRPLLDEDVYVQPGELAWRVAVVPLQPGMVVYRPFAVTSTEYRLVDDPALEVVSFPVDPARAVGGQLQPGHRVDVWRLVAVRPSSGITCQGPEGLGLGSTPKGYCTLTQIAAGQWATATLLVKDVPVVDVRAATGLAVARSPQALPGQVKQEERRTSSPGTLQILTVAVPRQVARDILALVAEEQAGAELWVSLAPLGAPEPAIAPTALAPSPTPGAEGEHR
jgi:hypothetical protein